MTKISKGSTIYHLINWDRKGTFIIKTVNVTAAGKRQIYGTYGGENLRQRIWSQEFEDVFNTTDFTYEEVEAIAKEQRGAARVISWEVGQAEIRAKIEAVRPMNIDFAEEEIY